MTPELEKIRKQVIANNENDGREFSLRYQYMRRHNIWRVYLMIVFSKSSCRSLSECYANHFDFYTVEDARAAVYRLNGWGVPKER